MPEKLSCANGHLWESKDVEGPCPVCGSAAESFDDGEYSTWDSGTGDELPPPPGAGGGSITLMTGGPDLVPAVPGYEIIGELGRGGMGVVYEARHRALNRRVALKVIRGFAGRDEVARFRYEAEAVARLQHPNIIQVYEVGEHAGIPYLALEFVDGGSLASRIRRAAAEPRAAAELVAELARAVQHAHSRGVIHRDLKPANILLTAGGAPKVGDFGLAKLGDDPGRSRSGLIIGTPSYMAPEQAAGRGDLVGPPADVWALGAILYECLTRRPPFLGENSAETVHQVLTTEPAAPARLAAGVPRDLDTICLMCLRKEPDQRYRTAGDLADDLTRFLEGRPIHARRVPWWEQLGKWARRRPAAAGLIVVTLAAGAALAGVGYNYYRDLEDHNRVLEDRNTTISRNVAELEERNATITQKSRDLELANAATVKERDRAEGNLLKTLTAVDGLLSISGVDRLAQVPHIDRTRAIMLERALQVCDKLLLGQEDNPRLRLFQGLTLQRAGKILTLLQRYKEAEERLDRALAILQKHHLEARTDTPGASFAKLEALTRLDRGKLFLRTGQPERARKEYAEVQILLETRTDRPDDPEVKFLAAVGNADLAVIALDEDETERAMLHLGRARQLLEEIFESGSKDVAFVGAYAFVLNTLGVAHMNKGQTDRAAELFERGIRVSRQLLEVIPSHLDYRTELARCLANLGATHRVRGYYKRAAVPLAEALAIREELARDHSDLGTLSIDLCWSYRQTGQLEQARGDSRSAAEWFTKAIDRLTQDGAVRFHERHARMLLADVYHARAGAREQLKLFHDGADDMGKAIELVPPNKRSSLRIVKAWLLADAGEIAKAVEEVEGALAKPDEVSSEMRFNAGLAFAKLAKLPNRTEEFAGRAVKELALAADENYFRDPKRRSYLDELPTLEHLRTRDDFNELREKVRRR